MDMMDFTDAPAQQPSTSPNVAATEDYSANLMGFAGGNEAQTYEAPAFETPAYETPAYTAPPTTYEPPAAFEPPAATTPQGFSADPFQGMPVSDNSMGGGGGMAAPKEVSKLREWEENHERELEGASRKEQSEKSERREAAAAELKTWYDERSNNNSKRKETNRKDEKASEAARADAMAPGANPWERVVDLIDTNAKTADVARDTSRMRSLLIQLKSNPIVKA
mmetsp:Transcript_41732/g.63071  ORF Transcript_41732/g.63071 Transcript_41732/m.63071 type:complete len:223 (-) Transcript_41732:120-788(-)